MPIVYILTNECMPDTIKIGVTENLDQRIRQLDNTSVALPFECYYAVEVSDAYSIEKKMHEGLDHLRIRQSREFFSATPEQAKSLLQIAEVMGGRNVTPTDLIVESEQDANAIRQSKNKRQQFNFGMVNIDPGTILTFVKNPEVICSVLDEKRVLFRHESLSLTKAALIVLNEMGYDWDRAAGPNFWCFEGQKLSDLRRQIEDR